jgi:hypothetical protein
MLKNGKPKLTGQNEKKKQIIMKSVFIKEIFL